MITGHFFPLASVDDHRDISLCRHGVIHLNWWNLTLRFLPDRFAQVVEVLAHGGQMLVSLGPWCDEDVCLESRDGWYVLTIGPVQLALDAQEYRELAEMARQAQKRLKSVLESGWLQEPEEDEAAPNFLETLHTMSFSQN